MVAGARVESGQPNLIFWRHETLPLALAYLQRVELVERLKAALKVADEVAQAVMYAAKVAVENRLTAQTGGRPDGKRVRQVLHSFAPERLYWSRLERPFRELLVALAAERADLDACVNCWYWDVLRPSAAGAYHRSIGRIDGGRDLKAAIAGRRLLYSRLKKIRNDHRIPDREKGGAA
jgi:hypothetical protein